MGTSSFNSGSKVQGTGAGAKVPPGHPESTEYAPLAEGLHPSIPVPRVSLKDVPLGKAAAQTSIDMANARSAARFDPAKIEECLRDGRVDNETRLRVITALAKDELFGDWKKRMLHWSREQQMRMNHLAMRRLLEMAEREDWGTQELLEAAFNIDQGPLSLHWVAFVPVLAGQASAEQQARWLGPAMNHEILGAYCQTEALAGSNVQNLQTTATYMPESDEFEIHSPSLGATKWWAGGAGLTATHVLVQAQLILTGKSYGPHLFLVPLRSLEDGSVFPNILVGDIGPKVYGGFGGLDNSWVRFDHVRIPRFNMLAKNAQVTEKGEYIKPPNDKLSYGGMVFIRSQMIDRQGWMLSRAITIATRYALVRRQFRDPDSTNPADLERSVLSYPSLNRRLVPILSRAYAYILAGRRMRSLYEEMAEQLDKGNTALLADVHVASSSLKAYCTKMAVTGIEESRAALGGHGFMAISGYNGIYPESLPTQTYEGDNYVLAQQVARALLKLSSELKQDRNAKTTETTSFVAALWYPDAIQFQAPTSVADWLQPEVFSAALCLRAARLVADYRAEADAGRRVVDLSWEAVEVATSHAEVVVNYWFAEAIRDDAERFGDKEVQWMNKLVALNALTCLARNVTPLALPMAKNTRGLAAYSGGTSILSAESVSFLEAAIRSLVEELLPQVIPLTDAFGWTDWELSSALGRKDGRVYEGIMAEAMGNPLNRPLQGRAPGTYDYEDSNTGKHVVEWYADEIRPLLKAAAARADEPIRGDGSKL